MYEIRPPEEVAADLARLTKSMVLNYELLVAFHNHHGWPDHEKDKLVKSLNEMLKQVQELDTLGAKAAFSVYNDKTLLYRIGKRVKSIGEEMLRLDAYVRNEGQWDKKTPQTY